MQIQIISPSGKTVLIDLSESTSLVQEMTKHFGESLGQYKFLFKNRIVTSDYLTKYTAWNNMDKVELMIPLLGSKGGFGSLLRSAAAHKKKLTNTDMCRTSNGRRVRMINTEKKLVEFLKKQGEEEQRIAKENEEYKEFQKNLRQKERTVKLSQEFKNKIEDLEKDVHTSIKDAVLLAKRRKLGLKNGAVDEKTPPTAGSEETDEAPAIKKKQQLTWELAPPESNGDADVKESAATVEEKKNIPQQVEIPATVAEVKPEVKAPEPVKTATADSEFAVIELTEIKSLEQLLALGAPHLTAELKRLGLKSGGTVNERAQRLWDVKLDPSKLFNPKYLAPTQKK